MSKRTLATTSSEFPYVSLDLLSYLKSKQVTPFQIFDQVIMPDFLHQISKKNQILPEGGSSSSNNNNGIAEEDASYYIQPQAKKIEEIQNDLIYINNACAKLEKWEDNIKSAMENFAYHALDDAFKERTGAMEPTNPTNSLQKNLEETHKIVSMLRESLCSPPELSSVNFNSQSFQRTKLSMIPGELELQNHSLDLPIKEIEAIYNDLGDTEKLCFLCFSVFPENVVIKKKVLVHWWVGEGFIDTLEEKETAEEKGKKFFKEFIDKKLIKPVFKKRRPNADSCKMDPSIRYAVITLAEREGFFNFDINRNPTEDFSVSTRACLVKTEDGSSIRELPYILEQEKVKIMINVNEPDLDFRPNWFSRMKCVKVLQLGRWQSSANHLIQVENSEFLKGLKNMRHLRYLSLRGVSRITELPASICKLTNLRILNLNGCLDLEHIPQGIGSLKNLTHLDMYECYLISHMPKGLASLSKLQVLKGFVIGEQKPGGKCCKLADLSSLANLRKLSIHVDKELKNAEKELNSLSRFEKLQSLSISWSRLYVLPKYPAATFQKFTKRLSNLSKSSTSPPPSRKDSVSQALPISLEKLNLEKLNLHYFPHSEMPNWLMQRDLPKLKKLHIRGGGSLSNLSRGQQYKWTVKTVRLKFLTKLEMDWPKLQGLFPDLMYLEIFECPNLSSMPTDENGVWKREDSEQEQASTVNHS